MLLLFSWLSPIDRPVVVAVSVVAGQLLLDEKSDGAEVPSLDQDLMVAGPVVRGTRQRLQASGNVVPLNSPEDAVCAGSGERLGGCGCCCPCSAPTGDDAHAVPRNLDLRLVAISPQQPDIFPGGTRNVLPTDQCAAGDEEGATARATVEVAMRWGASALSGSAADGAVCRFGRHGEGVDEYCMDIQYSALSGIAIGHFLQGGYPCMAYCSAAPESSLAGATISSHFQSTKRSPVCRRWV